MTIRLDVSGIRDRLAAEFGPVDVAVVARYVEDLVHAGALGWRP